MAYIKTRPQEKIKILVTTTKCTNPISIPQNMPLPNAAQLSYVYWFMNDTKQNGFGEKCFESTKWKFN